MTGLPFRSMYEHTLTGKAKEIYDKFKAAEQLPNDIKVSFWGKTPLMSPRVAQLMSDPDTRDLLMRATRGERQQPG